MEPTDWFRIRHDDPFPPETVAAFRASCAIYRAKVEAILQHWDHLPTMRTSPKPEVQFFPPEVSDDQRVLSLPIRVEPMTLGTRAFLQSSASRELYQYLPLAVVAGIDVGLTEPAFDGAGWRHDWWNPHRDNSIGPEEAFGQLGFQVKRDLEHRGRAWLVPGWRRRLQWLVHRLRGR